MASTFYDSTSGIFGVKITGMSELRSQLRGAGPKLLRQAGTATKQELEIEKREMQRRCPYKTGRMAKTHKVSDPEFTARTVKVSITAGGPEAPYTVYVHENLEAHHPHGEAKWMERVIMESKPYLVDRIGRRIDLSELK